MALDDAAFSARFSKSAIKRAKRLGLLRNAAVVLGISSERYSAYAGKRWGPGWKINAAGRRHALAEIESFRDDRQGFADKINAAVDMFS